MHQTARVNTILMERKWLEENLTNNSHQFVIVLKENDEPIGNCGFVKLDTLNQVAEVGILIGDLKDHNKGYGTEALKLLIDYGFNILNLHNIMLKVYSFNEKALFCYKKVGFKECGRQKEVYYLRNKRYDSISMEILRPDYFDGN